MRCTGEHCERKMDCARYYLNAKPDGEFHTLESLYYFGSGGGISSEGKVEENWWCNPLGNWGMFIPIERTNADRIRAMTDEELAECLVFEAKCTGCNAENCDEEFCLNFMKDWLKQQAEVNR